MPVSIRIWAGVVGYLISVSISGNAQSVPDVTSTPPRVPAVFKIEARLPNPVSDRKRSRYLTGFYSASEQGVITALHGVVGAEVVLVVDPAPTAERVTLEVIAVDIARDLALLRPNAGTLPVTEGLFHAADIDRSNVLVMCGYPHNVVSQIVTEMHDSQPEYRALSTVLDHASRVVLGARNSPSLDTRVLFLRAHIRPGESGAPVMNANGHVVAVANGGLAGGATELTWAIPLADISFCAVDDLDNEALAFLTRSWSSGLFSGVHEDGERVLFLHMNAGASQGAPAHEAFTAVTGATHSRALPSAIDAPQDEAVRLAAALSCARFAVISVDSQDHATGVSAELRVSVHVPSLANPSGVVDEFTFVGEYSTPPGFAVSALARRRAISEAFDAMSTSAASSARGTLGQVLTNSGFRTH